MLVCAQLKPTSSAERPLAIDRPSTFEDVTLASQFLIAFIGPMENSVRLL
jgi:hypothetical protein